MNHPLLLQLCKVRTAERSVEGRHAIINRIHKRAPRASTGYVSLEMRFASLQTVASTKPQLLRGVSNMISGLETHSGQVVAVMFLNFNSMFTSWDRSLEFSYWVKFLKEFTF